MAKRLWLLAFLLLPIIWSAKANAEEFYLPENVKALAGKYATEDIQSELVQAVIWTESSGNAEAISADGYNVGLMQLHVWYFSGDLYDPDNNVQQGTEYLQTLYDRYGDINTALMAYHGERDLTKPPSYYARSIVALAAEIKEARKEEHANKAKARRPWECLQNTKSE